MSAHRTIFGFFCFVALAALADDRTLTMSISSLLGSPPSFAVIGVTAGSAGNPSPSMISFHVEYSDDLSSWTPLHSFDYSGTNTQPTIATNLTIGQTALFGDVQAGNSSHRFYRAVQEAQ
jgi:hypothetical protein